VEAALDRVHSYPEDLRHLGRGQSFEVSQEKHFPGQRVQGVDGSLQGVVELLPREDLVREPPRIREAVGLKRQVGVE
jgi:hypothetical protein